MQHHDHFVLRNGKWGKMKGFVGLCNEHEERLRKTRAWGKWQAGRIRDAQDRNTSEVQFAQHRETSADALVAANVKVAALEGRLDAANAARAAIEPTLGERTAELTAARCLIDSLSRDLASAKAALTWAQSPATQLTAGHGATRARLTAEHDAVAAKYTAFDALTAEQLTASPNGVRASQTPNSVNSPVNRPLTISALRITRPVQSMGRGRSSITATRPPQPQGRVTPRGSSMSPAAQLAQGTVKGLMERSAGRGGRGGNAITTFTPLGGPATRVYRNEAEQRAYDALWRRQQSPPRRNMQYTPQAFRWYGEYGESPRAGDLPQDSSPY